MKLLFRLLGITLQDAMPGRLRCGSFASPVLEINCLQGALSLSFGKVSR